MANFDSPIGKKNIRSAPQKEFVVDDFGDVDGNRPQMPQPRSHQHVQYDPVALENFSKMMNASDEKPQQYEEYDAEELMRQDEFRRLKQEKATGKMRMSSKAKSRIEHLLGFTRPEKELKIANATFVIRTLTAEQYRYCLLNAATEERQVQYDWSLKTNVVAYALKSVEGISLEEFIDSDLQEDRVYFLNKMENSLLEKLYKEVVELTKSTEEEYGLNTPNVQKEVSEDLKK